MARLSSARTVDGTVDEAAAAAVIKGVLEVTVVLVEDIMPLSNVGAFVKLIAEVVGVVERRTSIVSRDTAGQSQNRSSSTLAIVLVVVTCKRY